MRVFIQLIDGRTISGESPEEIVHEMNNQMLTPDETIHHYMIGVKRRTKIWNGYELEYHEGDFGGFLTALRQAQIIVRIFWLARVNVSEPL